MLNFLKDRISANKKNIAEMSTGTLIGQIISVLTLPILTRIYGAEVIGIWTLLNSISIVVISFADLGLTNVIMVEDEAKIVRTYKVVTSTVAIISIIASSIITLYFILFPGLENINKIFLFIFMVLSIFTTQQIQICYTWLNRKGHYNVLMKNPIIKNGIFGLLAILLGLIKMNKYGYFIGYILGQIATLIHMREKLPNSMFTIKWADYKECVKSNKQFVKFQMPSNVISNFSNQIPILLIKGLWGNQILGYYSITVKLLQIPSALLATAIGRVFFQIISSMKRRGEDIGQYVYRNLVSAMKIGIIPITLLMAFGDIIVNTFLGDRWEMTGDFIRILSLQYFFIFLVITIQGLSITLEKQKYEIFNSIFQIIGYVLGALIGKHLFDNINVGLIVMSILLILVNTVYIGALYKVLDISIRKYVASVFFSIISILLLSITIRSVFDFLGFTEIIIRFS